MLPVCADFGGEEIGNWVWAAATGPSLKRRVKAGYFVWKYFRRRGASLGARKKCYEEKNGFGFGWRLLSSSKTLVAMVVWAISTSILFRWTVGFVCCNILMKLTRHWVGNMYINGVQKPIPGIAELNPQNDTFHSCFIQEGENNGLMRYVHKYLRANCTAAFRKADREYCFDCKDLGERWYGRWKRHFWYGSRKRSS